MTLQAKRVGLSRVGRLTGDLSAISPAVAALNFDEYLEISVTDTGIGVSGRDLDHLFQPFIQIDSGLARKFEGTGLGLAMTKQLAELHGGAVAVESAVQEGSRFTVWLPFRWAGMERASPALSALPPVLAGEGALTALIVEDDLNSAGLIKLQLEARGFTVVHATNAETAPAVAAEQPLDLITLGIMLPNMDGWEFHSRLQQIPSLARVSVVIISFAADLKKVFSSAQRRSCKKPVLPQGAVRFAD